MARFYQIEIMYSTSQLIKKLDDAISYLPVKERNHVAKAIEFARQAHDGQLRKSGEPYINHPLSTALILADLKVDTASITAAILHDVVEDTAVEAEQLTLEFGSEVAKLVDGVTKVSHIRLKKIDQDQDYTDRHLESLRKLFLAMAEDYRVVLIKLADRLHNMRTLQYIPSDKQSRIATETMEIYVPLANRLGLWPIKSELEDCCFKFLQPDLYTKLFQELKEKTTTGKVQIDKIIRSIKQTMKKNNLPYVSVNGRTKNIYSIYLKTLHKNLVVDEIYDIYAIRIITRTVKDCYAILGLIHSISTPIPGRFKDYIAVPKSNGYQSLHTSVFTKGGQQVEIQIRTEEMHQHAEKGIAAHWLYKEKKSSRDFAWIKDLENLKDVDLTELSRQLKIDIFEDRIFIYTPGGDVIDLPQDSTPIDFAFQIHSELGHKLVGAKANQKIVPLDYKIQSGDIVEILTAKNSTGPKREWLEMARTNNAKSKIRSFLKKKNYQQNRLEGEKILNQEISRLNLAPVNTVPETNQQKMLDDLPYKNFDDILVAIATGDITVKRVIKYLYPESEIFQNRPARTRFKKIKDTSIVFGQNQRLSYKLSTSCCHPVFPKMIVGYITRGHGISVHELTCRNIKDKDVNRLIPARWEKLRSRYTVELEIKCDNEVGMLHKITGIIVQDGLNLEGVRTMQGEVNYAKIIITLNVNDYEDLTSLIEKLLRISGIKSVRRI